MVFFLTTECVACHAIFSCNPYRVPVLVVNGERCPVCRTCAAKWNVLHPEIARPILPGAYDPVDDGATNDDPWEAGEP